MRILIIDNGIKHTDRLQAICVKHDVQVVAADVLQDSDEAVQAADVLIIAGSYENKLIWEQQYFMHEVELVRLTDKPVLGIGLGFELICYAFGCQLHEESERAAGAISVRPTGDGSKVFQGTDPIKASETQRWAVDDVPRELVVLARSDNGIEAVRHKTRQIFGLQLQPEDFVYASDGKMVFENILDAFRKK